MLSNVMPCAMEYRRSNINVNVVCEHRFDIFDSGKDGVDIIEMIEYK
jgi:hypothetical protein